MQLPNPSLPWPIPMEGVALIAESEGLALQAYKCPAGVWTCGYGETAGVGPKTKWTKDFADQRFCDSLSERTDAVRAMVTVETSDNQLAALVSLAYNIGNAALAKSTVLRAHNSGDFSAASRAFGLWSKATVGGVLKVLPGLVTRRAREAALYSTPENGAASEPMPQSVAPEPAMSKSPTVTVSGASVIAGATGILAQVGDGAEVISKPLESLKTTAVDLLGIPSVVWPWALLAVVGLVILYRRYKQRHEGAA